MRCPHLAGLIALASGAAGCSGPARSHDLPLFEMLPPEVTGVTFVNQLAEDTAFNILNYLYYYDGGGVGVGDVDNDGLPDLYFTSSLGSNRLYRNLGNYRFEDITAQANVAGPPGWKTGVAMADVNGDGFVDIYVSAVNHLSMRGHNVLYINTGHGTFVDSTEAYGLGFAGFSTQALFFDYDRDGDLDMYLLNHATHSERLAGRGTDADVHAARNPRASDRLYRNDAGGGHFVDVSASAGIVGGVEFGLGVVASDLNGDGCMDLYVANDFQENDYLYVNDCRGRFVESLAKAMPHTSRFSMGVDAADFNNDGRPDLMSADMLPEREDILKSSANGESVELFNRKIAAGYHPQFARNALQLNRGGLRFSDIGYLAGVSATDWSWAPLFADLDNDGRKDLFVTAGIYRRPNDLDYIDYISSQAIQESLARGISAANLSVIRKMPQVPQPNHAFRNDGDLHFTNVAAEWGLAQPGFSNGAVYVDLNNTGALDLVVNRIDAPAAIYRNRSRDLGRHFLRVRLRGAGKNTHGIGATVILHQGPKAQLLEQMPTRGFQSSVDPRLHFGLGDSARVDSLIVIWADQRFQVLRGVAGDREITVVQDSASGRYERARARAGLFADVTSESGLDYRHRENDFLDYAREPLLPRLLSTEGPALAVGDVNGDSLDDVYVGGAKWQAGRLYLQQRDGRFRPASDQRAFAADSLAEDVDAAFFDADGDGDLDLYVVSGGNEFWGDADALQDRLYLSDGEGNFTRSKDALPRMMESGSRVAVGDFSGDGRPDLFVGRRAMSRRYGMIPRSYLLQNDGTGRFVDVTAEQAPELAEAGMVTSAAWVDVDRDSLLDLVVVGEWMPIRVFRRPSRSGAFRDMSASAGLAATTGWWNSVEASDVTGDGRPDLILGNLGLNSYIRASPERPARMYVSDFAGNGTLQQIITFYKDSVSYPLADRDDILRKNDALRGKYPSYASFGASRVEDIFPAKDLRGAKTFVAEIFANAVAINRPDGTFDLRALPAEAQLGPVYASTVGDFDGDGKIDVVVAGNFYGVIPMLGRYDASYGLLLRGDGAGVFTPVDMQESGLALDGQVRRLKVVRTGRGGSRIVAARNNDRVQILRPTR